MSLLLLFGGGAGAPVVETPTTLDADITLGLAGRYSRPVGLGLAVFDLPNHPLGRLEVILANGIDLGEADKAYLSNLAGVTLGPSASVSLDLSGLTDDALGQDLELVAVKAVILWARPENLHDLIVGNGTNPFVGWFGSGTHTESVPPGSPLIHVSRTGWPVVNGVSDILKITNAGANDVVYDLAIFGTSA